MKVIELIIKVANGESVPEVIEYQGRKYGLIDYGKTKIYLDKDEPHEGLKFSTQNLHDNVEIIEENKAIEKLEGSCDTTTSEICRFNNIEVKINELIDEVNKLKKEMKERDKDE